MLNDYSTTGCFVELMKKVDTLQKKCVRNVPSSKIAQWAFICIFRLDCGALFGNLFWHQFECQNTNSFERKIRIETSNIQHVLVSMWTRQFFQNLKFSSSYFSPRQKSYKATQQLSSQGQSNSSKTKEVPCCC